MPNASSSEVSGRTLPALSNRVAGFHGTYPRAHASSTLWTPSRGPWPSLAATPGRVPILAAGGFVEAAAAEVGDGRCVGACGVLGVEAGGGTQPELCPVRLGERHGCLGREPCGTRFGRGVDAGASVEVVEFGDEHSGGGPVF